MQTLHASLTEKINTKTKPPGALGMLETLALQAGLVQQSVSPVLLKPHIVVFAGDHGVSASGMVNAYPQAVTAQMVLNFINGGAAINVFCKQHNIELTVVDAGVNYDFETALPIIHAKIRKGTNDYTNGPAMSIDEVKHAIQKGKNIVSDIHNTGCNTIGFGEMGIGNTSAASLIMHHYTRLPLVECVGRGTGLSDEQLAQKIKTLETTAQYHHIEKFDKSPHELLASIGGFEIAMMAGAYISAYELGMLILTDGFIATAALYCAIALLNMQSTGEVTLNNESELLRNCIFTHASGEKGHHNMLQKIAAKPLLNLGLRLGEGTGAALAMPLLQSAVNFLNEMASFETAGVSGSTQ